MLVGRLAHLRAPAAQAGKRLNPVTLWQRLNVEQNSQHCKTSGVVNVPEEGTTIGCSGGVPGLSQQEGAALQ